MDLTPMHKRVIALDVHQAKITACAVVEHDDGRLEVTKRDFGAFKRDRRALAQWALEIAPEVVVMESTGVYWKSPFAALEAYRPYIAAQLAAGTPLSHMTRHMLGVMHGLPGARAFRRIMTVEAAEPGAGLEVVDRAIAAVHDTLAAAEARRILYEASLIKSA